jgi:hypothetical protein
MAKMKNPSTGRNKFRAKFSHFHESGSLDFRYFVGCGNKINDIDQNTRI